MTFVRRLLRGLPRSLTARRSRRDRLPPGADQDALTQQFRSGL